MRTRCLALALFASACGGSEPATGPDATPADVTADAPPPDVAAPDAPDASTPDASAPDASAPDASTDASTDATQPDAAISLCSRQLLPMSTARVTSQRPTLQFARAPGLRDTLVEVCRDRACRDVALSLMTSDDYVSPSANLAPGVYFWRITPRNADGATCTSATWQFTVPARSVTPPRSWGASLDVNGDGYADLAVASVSASGAGEVRVYHGSPSGLGDAAVTLADLPTRAPQFEAPPMPVAAGDLNGDGFADLAVGLAAANEGDGEVRVYLGSPRGVSSRADAELRGPDGRFGRFGASLAGFGDVEGDGYADLAVGAPFAQAASATDDAVPGRVYVFHGLPNGVRYTPTTTVTGPAGARGAFGASLSGAGDVNSDRFPDLAVGAPGAGRAYVFRGTALGLATTALVTFEDAMTPGFGALVGGAGDIDGDGRADVFIAGSSGARLVVRAAGRDSMFSVAPRVLTVTGAAVADVNADGYSDLVAVSAGDVTGFTGGAMGLSAMSSFTAGAARGPVVSVGDVNRDGFSDLAAITDAGAVVVLHGRASGEPSAARTVMTSVNARSLGGAWGGL